MRSLLVFLLILNVPLWAWDEGGHEIVACLAYARLNQKAKLQVDQLAQQITSPYGSPYNHYTVACWMDDLKGESKMACVGLFKPWHFIDLGLDASDPQPDFQPGSDNETQGNIVQALQRVDRVLQGGTDPYISSPALACAMAIHLVADIHQPLHAATRYFTKGSGQLTNDRGGNRLYLTQGSSEKSTRWNLHAFWDSAWRASLDDAGQIVLDPAFADGRAHGNPRIYALAETWAHDHDQPAQGTDLSFAPEIWARESNLLARDKVYADLLPGERRNQARLTQAYVRMARNLAREQLVLASLRLADLLNRTLGAD